MQDKDFGVVIDQIRQLNQEMAAHDDHPWKLEQKVLDLQTQVGFISRAALEKGHYKPQGKDLAKIDERLATILILLVDIGDELDVNLPAALSKIISKE